MISEPLVTPRRRWPAMVAGVLALGVAVFLLVRDDAVFDALRVIDPLMLGVVGVLQVANTVTDSLRYHMVFPRRYRDALPLWRWHHIFSVGRLLNMLVPQAGTAYRAARLRMSHGVPVASFMGGIAAITWLGNGVALVLTALVLLGVGSVVVGVAVLAVGIGLVAIVGLLPRLSRSRAGAPGRLPGRVAAAAATFGESFVELARTPGRLLRVLAISSIAQLSGAVAYVLVCVALDVPDPLVAGVVLYASTTIVTVVSLTPGGIGITELAAAAAGVALDLGAGVGVLVALIIRITGTLSVTLLFGAAMLRDGVDTRSDSPQRADP